MTPEEAAKQEQEIEARVRARLGAAQPAPQPMPQPMGYPQAQPGYGQPQPGMMPAGQMSPYGGMQAQAPVATGLLIPIKIQMGGGNLRVMLQFPAEVAQNPQATMALIHQLEAMGVPLDIWRPQGNGYGNRGGGGGYRG